MSNINEDRRQSCVDFKCKPYRDNWNDKKITYIVMAINDINNRITDFKDK